MELSNKSLNNGKLRGNKQLRKMVKKELFLIGLVNSGDFSCFDEYSYILENDKLHISSLNK